MSITEKDTLFNPDQLADKARELAKNRDPITTGRRPIRSLQGPLDSALDILKKTYRTLSVAAQKEKEISPAGEWLLDNFYIVQEQVIQVKEDLPRSYYRRLPRMASGTFKGYPRIYQLVRELAFYTDNIIDDSNIELFVHAYQEEELLSLGELWAIPIMIRLVLIQELKRRSQQILKSRRVRKEVQNWVDKISESAERKPSEGIRQLVKMAEELPNISPQFMARITNRLQASGNLMDLQRNWLELQFEDWGTTLEEELRKANEQESRLQVSVCNAVLSLRRAAETDWADFVEDTSLVERTLRLDPAGEYAYMDFPTRDMYRKRVEQLSNQSPLNEFEVAEQVLLLAEQRALDDTNTAANTAHIGLYLIGEGKRLLEEKIDYRRRFGEGVYRLHSTRPVLYISEILLLTIALMAIPIGITESIEHSWYIIGILVLLLFWPAHDVAISVVNRLVTLLVPPKVLPKLAFREGIPDYFRTLVVVPAIVGSVKELKMQLEQLEIRFLSNTDPNLRYVLLSDFKDADKQRLPKDREILEAASKHIQRLNRQYADKLGDRFFLLHRERRWNESEKCWMGWERKRGKLEELNRLLRDPNAPTSFMAVEGNFREITADDAIRYVITLDADTKLPPGSAVDLVRTAAHSLNQPWYDEEAGRVTKGYGILQPRISIVPESAHKTRFAHIFSGHIGLDPYTKAVSDVYQDLFGEGSYTGKGLYHVDTFFQVLDRRLPENRILSHDLLEGNHVRTALVTDIELFDDYPSTYLSYIKRMHRWVRGDWQILFWLLPRVPSLEGKARNPVHWLGRWKVFDNLRRSINPSALLLLLLFGWTLFPGSALVWTLAAVGVTAFPIYANFSTDIFRRPARVAWRLYLDKIMDDLKVHTRQSILTLVLMPHMAYMMNDAILRTFWRMFVSRKKLLEWTTASQIEAENDDKLAHYFRAMYSEPVWALVTAVLIYSLRWPALIIAVPFIIAWVTAPWVAWWTSRSIPHKEPALKAEQRKQLRIYARRTWAYFDRFVTEDHYWLPPDNVQIDPPMPPAARTSPTNIGLGLMSLLTAYDFGYISYTRMINRMHAMFLSIDKLDRYRGHFYNWYSTKIGEVLNPRYVSTVDSGNMAGCLVALKQGLNRIDDRIWPNPGILKGLRDTLLVLDENIQFLQDHDELTEVVNALKEARKVLWKRIPDNQPTDLEDFSRLLDALENAAQDLAGLPVQQIRGVLGDAVYEEHLYWVEQPLQMISCAQEELFAIRELRPELQKATTVRKLPEVQPKNVHEGRENDEMLEHFSDPVQQWKVNSRALAAQCTEWINEMDFRFLFDRKRKLFSIGYNVDKATLDDSTYDLFASEARLASLVAIAKGDVSAEHWFRLSRRLTQIDNVEILLSWGGTMFEYLMPLLFMRRYPDTLLEETYKNVVRWQADYGAERGRPWGFSESGYNVINLNLDYQYRAFGAPGLGLKRGLAEEYVLAPYATMLALMVDSNASLLNLERLKEVGAYGLMGFYEAVDYTPSRLTPEEDKGVVHSYMAHHQGMSLLALANVLIDNIVQQDFHQDPQIRSCELLLQERIPRAIPITNYHPIELELEPGQERGVQHAVDYSSGDELVWPMPRVHLLSNGTYHAMVTNAGTGYSSCNGVDLTRWVPDRVEDRTGFFIYIRDLDTDEYWSMGYQPTGKHPDRYESWYHPGKVQMARVDDWTETFMDICISPEENMELRKITLTNYAEHKRRLEVTSFAEVALNAREADASHPAFSKLFIETEYLPEYHSILARRRPRSENEDTLWMIHTLASEEFANMQEPLQFETDRAAFIGRGRNAGNPAAMDPGSRLGGASGNVLDPIVSLRQTIELDPGQKKQLSFGLGMAYSREEARALADRYDSMYAVNRAFELATVYSTVELEQLDLSGDRALYFHRLAGSLLYNDPRFRAPENVLRQNRLQQSGLWAYGISGDLPIFLLYIGKQEDMKTVRRLLKAHALWRKKGLDVDLCIINEHPPSYADELQQTILQAIQTSPEHRLLNKRGGIFVLRGSSLPEQDMILLQSVAHVVADGKLPDLRNRQEEETAREQKQFEIGLKSYKPADPGLPVKPSAKEEKLFDNGYGGFDRESGTYRIDYAPDDQGRSVLPPMPWSNVIANDAAGTLVTEKGMTYTWTKNSRENRLTPWSNDPVMDPPGEAIYLRDESSDVFWTPTPGPVDSVGQYEIEHGWGFSRYRHQRNELKQEVCTFMAGEAPLKVTTLRLENTGTEPRTITVFGYSRLVLGIRPENSARHIQTWYEPDRHTIRAVNNYNNEFAGRQAFSAVLWPKDAEGHEFTADREFFIGRNATLASPRAIELDLTLNSGVGCGLDACAAHKARITIPAGESRTVSFLLGETDTEEEAHALLEQWYDQAALDKIFTDTVQQWKNELGSVKVKTPDASFDLMVNGWLQYQDLSCRIQARSAFYQSGGAYGFRDQLQDVLALLRSRPDLVRDQLLRHARHQFGEGDVLHWWHPPTGRGIRSRITDDLLWMPYAAVEYVRQTGDESIWEETVPFLRARQLDEGEHEAYLQPRESDEEDTFFEHCCRAVDRSLTKGKHGLPLMGSGDWNDGMNRVGQDGKGESVWLGFFLYEVLNRVIPVCAARKAKERETAYSKYRDQLHKSLNKAGWDGHWFRRAYFDDGTPLGSSTNDECRIDAIAQAWSVLSGGGEPDKSEQAMQAVREHLVAEAEGIIRLLTPPFDKTEKNPGYIKGYVPGVRENGGQYTHAAIWTAIAFAELGKGSEAGRLLHMIVPVNHSTSREAANRYKVEPYVVAADVYGVTPHTGRGGWTWYTGSAGWLYRAIVEWLLGFRLNAGREIVIKPAIPSQWKEFEITYRPDKEGTMYTIQVQNPDGIEQGLRSLKIDEKEHAVDEKQATIPLQSDGKTHQVLIVMGK